MERVAPDDLLTETVVPSCTKMVIPARSAGISIRAPEPICDSCRNDGVAWWAKAQ